jgi:hypothetical protein
MGRRAARLARSLSVAALESAAGRLGLRLYPDTFYSPFPEVERLHSSLWQSPRKLAGMELDVDAHFELLEHELAPYVRELGDCLAAGEYDFEIANGSYESVDAELLYALVRSRRPASVVELGSGASTVLIEYANGRNAADGGGGRHVVFDPYRSPAASPPRSGCEHVALAVQDLELDVFCDLRRGDMLFVDTTHTVKTGGDVNRLVLDVLPALAAGVLVHFHDVFLPWEYPREWVLEGRCFAEQDLLQAFLAYNPSYRVLLAAHAMARTDPGRLARVVPSFAPGVRPGAFWIEPLGP